MKKHEQPGFDFTKGLTPEDMLQRLKEFALYGLDECLEVEQLMEKLEAHLTQAKINNKVLHKD